MKKSRWRKPWILVILVIAALIVLWMLKAPIMSSYLSSKLKVHVSLAGITMRPSYTKIYRFRINNPLHARTRTALSVKKIRLDYQFHQIFSDPTTIDLIEMNDVFLGIEFYNPLGTKNNWSELLAELEQKKKEPKEVLIRKLVINDLKVEIRGMGLNAILGKPLQTKHIARLEFYNINSRDGFPTDQLIQQIFGSTGLKGYIKDLFDPPSLIKGIFKPFSLDEKRHPQKEDALVLD